MNLDPAVGGGVFMMKGFFVTGTDTGVGKTVVSAALVHAYAARGERVAGLKPVVSGAVDGVWEDVEILRQASVPPRSREECNLYAFPAAIAPHWAAQQVGQRIDLDAILRFLEEQAAGVDRVIVEGAGGFLVPLGDGRSFADLALGLRLPVVLVVDLRLGAINHALLSAEAIIRRGLPWGGWVGNHVRPQPVAAGTLEGLQEGLPGPCLGVFPYHAAPRPQTLSRCLNLSASP
ncbi:dethiobiotin synthase [Acidithiobacillus sp.]